jgi:hypothetical protein
MKNACGISIDHPLAHQLYNYISGRRFDPGAPAEAFQPLFQLPVISFRGRARLAGQFLTLQPPQVWFDQQSGINGLGGLQFGQLISQPLIDPSNQE